MSSSIGSTESRLGGIPPKTPAAILAHIHSLHEELKTNAHGVRHRIDAHLLSCYVNPSVPPPHLVLAPEYAYHYLNLPDLTHFLRSSLARNVWDDTLISSLMSPFCLHVKVAAKSSTTVMRAAALNLLHGLLLGLYPYAIRHMEFERRCQVAGRVRELMCGTEASKTDFIASHESLLTLAMSEYLVNVLGDFCPVEEQVRCGCISVAWGIRHDATSDGLHWHRVRSGKLLWPRGASP